MRKYDFDFLIDLLYKHAGWNFSEKEYFSIDKKISNFIREKGFASVEDLILELKKGSKVVTSQVIECLAFADTRFFRDYEVFNQFEEYVLPMLKETNRNLKKLRILSLGCSTGQEVYSIAILVNKVLGLSDWQIDIIGTDLCFNAISQAQRGVYDQFEIQNGMNAGVMIDNFTLDGTSWKVNDNIKNMVTFRQYNLLDEATFKEEFDVIFCRNVLRFFTPEIQKKLCEKIYAMQVKGGFLYVGKGEKIPALKDFYSPINGMSCTFQYKQNANVSPENKSIYNSEDIPANDDMPHFVRPVSLSGQHPIMADVLRK